MWFRENWTEEELSALDAQKGSISAEVSCLADFTIQLHHIMLASRLAVEHEDDGFPYEGVFKTDAKRPFGNKPWDQDIAIELGEKTSEDFQEMPYEEYMKWYKENYLRMYRVFQETKLVMQIALQNMTLKIDPGMKFTRGRFSGNWNVT